MSASSFRGSLLPAFATWKFGEDGSRFEQKDENNGGTEFHNVKEHQHADHTAIDRAVERDPEQTSWLGQETQRARQWDDDELSTLD